MLERPASFMVEAVQTIFELATSTFLGGRTVGEGEPKVVESDC